MDGAMVTLEANLHPMATTCPLGADTTDSLSDDAGSQISVIRLVVSNISSQWPQRLHNINGVVAQHPLQLSPQ